MLLESNNIRQIDFKYSIPQEFYLQSPEMVAKELLGKLLVRKYNDILLAGIIIETEAYLSNNDKSSHSFIGKTKRNTQMFNIGGSVYVYQIYGINFCLNVVTEPEGIGSAVLIRAIQPCFGIEIMKVNRKKDDIKKLCKGPGCLAQAFGFTKEDNNLDFLNQNLFIQEWISPNSFLIQITERIGINKSKDLPLRFYIKDNNWISSRK